ncbi:midasin nuclear AAA ATPase [Mycena floridula]|nr:midasin nuclear AAA ATPase [Mycena floridula]
MFDPLRLNLRRQTARLLVELGDSPHTIKITSATAPSALLAVLSQLLTVPELTVRIADLYRPILFDLCARWIDAPTNVDQLVALSLLLQVHQQLFPILYRILLKPELAPGPLAHITSDTEIDILETQRLILAYYRILQANRQLPGLLFWPLTPLSILIWTPNLHNGIRLLSIRCYALQSGMVESVREELEKKVLGDADCFINYGQTFDGSHVEMDAWVFPVFELRQVQEAREALATVPQEYHVVDEDEILVPISPLDLSPLVVNIHGVFMLRDTVTAEPPSTVVPTRTTVETLRSLALHLSLRLPILLTSPPSSGKSLLLSHLAQLLFPGAANQIVYIHLADTSLDPRSLLGSYVSSQTQPGTFEWKEGVLVRAMREGKWIVFKDIDRGSSEVLGVLKPLIESQSVGQWIGGRASLEVPGRGRVVAAHDFSIFATRSVPCSSSNTFSSPVFFGAHKLHEITLLPPSPDELRAIVDSKFRRLAGPTARALVRVWQSVKGLGPAASTRDVGLRELEKFCHRVERILPASFQPMDVDTDEPVPLTSLFPHTKVREEIYLNARDVFFGAGTLTSSARAHIDAIARVIAEHLGFDSEKQDSLLNKSVPELDIEKDVNGRPVAVCIGRTRLVAKTTKMEIAPPVTRPFALHRPAVLLLSRIASAVALSEPVLLTGETGTGKTSVVTHLASLLRRPLISLNLSHQTESADLIGGFKPVDTRIPASLLLEQFFELFSATFSRKKNQKFEGEVRKAVLDGKWKRAVGLWRESTRLAKERIQSKNEQASDPELDDPTSPRKRRKLDGALKASDASWTSFERSVDEFETQHVLGKNKFAFDFVEGSLVKALRSGDWVLLDEVNLASPETLECISGLLHSPTSSITLTEQGSLEPIPRHPDFRLFACMNPATDVGKKDLPPNIRSRFTEIDVPPPDADLETLLSIVTQYIGPSASGDKKVILQVAEFYLAVKALAESRQIADGSNHRPHFSMRTLTRALTFAADTAASYGLRRALLEGCLMAFTMVLDAQSAEAVTALAHEHLLKGAGNSRSVLSREPPPPPFSSVKFGPFYLQHGPLAPDPVDNYIMTPSVQKKLTDLSRIILTRRFPVLIEGPTSSGKTSAVEYLAKRTGHQFIRINNHEHTDIQEYLGSYVPDPSTGKLVFKDGLLVRALREGHWLVLDELNLAPTDVLEALNRLLDDNRELVIPETQEVVIPHEHFMLFATQNPPGLYAGRKVLSRAFRNRFLEVHFEDVPQPELETILCERCAIAPSYGKKIVAVFCELQKRRQAGRVFESKHGFATLRDLFRWAGRDAVGYQELAENGYMLLAERTRREDDKLAVKEVIESIMRVKIDERAMYDFQNSAIDFPAYLDCRIPESNLVWTTAMQRLFVLVSRALRFKEPVLLVGETGSGKTSVSQVYADTKGQRLHGLNCHQNTETADLIGGLRPIRNRSSIEAEISKEAATIFMEHGITESPVGDAAERQVQNLIRSSSDAQTRSRLQSLQRKLVRLKSVFEWHDGPLVEAMQSGDVFLLDEIALADDSVLERLNSVLEPARTLVLAEKGGDDQANPTIKAVEEFKLVATMNPGGDYGKKELSPALRNRFTEIWVPAVNDRADLELIVNAMWGQESLKSETRKVLDFVQWLCDAVGDQSLMNLRDILAWVVFSTTTERQKRMSHNEIFHHAAHLAFIDGLASLPQLSGYSRDAVAKLKIAAISKLQELAPIDSAPTNIQPSSELGPFSISNGPLEILSQTFNFGAPTTRDNAMRVVRACQVMKPILLEGSPGVGKTSLVTALAKFYGYHLHRVNLSDQTDLMDLFGSDLPVEGGGPGEFAWKDAEFLRSLQEGHWVLLDEMNLAPQAVLEGLNAVLDHRGTVYIPELGRSFNRHPSFRIFAAQNPLSQGGGRKGLPKSFLNRFTKVYIEELSPDDLSLVCEQIFPALDPSILRRMVAFNMAIAEAICTQRAFAHEGSPWEFNLRDVIRWGTLISSDMLLKHPSDYLRSIYLHRFRTIEDRQRASIMFDQTFGLAAEESRNPPISVSASFLQLGHFNYIRSLSMSMDRPPRVLKMQLSALESAGHCVSQSWLTILTGPRNSGKTHTVRTLANLTGNLLHEISVNSATDTMDILGSFEQVDVRSQVTSLTNEVLSIVLAQARSKSGSRPSQVENCIALQRAVQDATSLPSLLEVVFRVITNSSSSDDSRLLAIRSKLENLTRAPSSAGRFEWVDGPLIKAMRQGHWVLLDGANLCNPSVLDRLNSVCEPDGVLTLTERGYVEGQVQLISPHRDFRLFMSVDPQFGELSRAMRNRGIEIALVPQPLSDDLAILQDFYRLPQSSTSELFSQFVAFESIRRGLASAAASRRPLTVTTGRALDHDSALTNLADQASVFFGTTDIATDALTHVFARTVVPTYSRYWLRFFSALPKDVSERFNQAQAFLHAFDVDLIPQVAVWREAYTSSRGVSSASVLSQPIDFYLNAPQTRRPEPDSFHHPLLGLLGLAVGLLLQQSLPASSHQRVDPSGKSQIAQSALESVLTATRDHCSQLVKVYDASDSSKVVTALEMLKFSRRLAKSSDSIHFDYSAVQAISTWLGDSLDKAPSTWFPELRKAVQSLQDAILLKSGLGLVEIWSAFLTTYLWRKMPHLLRLESASSHVELSGKYEELRRHVFNFMALHSLGSEVAPAELLDLQERMERHLIDNNPDAASAVLEEDSSFVLAELGLLAIYADVTGLIMPKVFVPSLEELIRLSCRTPRNSLLRLVSLQHLIWAIDADQDVFPIVVDLHWQTMESLCSVSIKSGSSALLGPTQLNAVLSICEWKPQPLSSIREYEMYIHRQTRLAVLQCGQVTSRIEQLESLLRLSILKLLTCFGSTSLTDRASSMGFNEILALLAAVDNSAFTAVAQTHLIPVLRRLVETNQTRQSRIATLGTCFVAVCKVFMDLFVPDAPIDPAAIHACSEDFWCEDKEFVTSQIKLHEEMEMHSTGNTENTVIDYLNQSLSNAIEKLQDIPSFPPRPDSSRLHLFWSEIWQFQKQITSSSKLDILLRSLSAGDQASASQETVIQDSILGFAQRLDKVYPQYDDISGWVYTWLSIHNLLPELSQVSKHCLLRIIAFPTINSSSQLRSLQNLPSAEIITPFRGVVLNLAFLTLEVSFGVQVDQQWLQDTFEQAIRLWLIDRAKDAEAESNLQSLYRQKKTEYDSVSDAELEERELLALFPSYEEGVDQVMPEISGPTARFVEASGAHQLVTIHQALLLPQQGSAKNVRSIINSIRQSTISSLLQSQFPALQETLDLESIPIQLRTLHTRLSDLQRTSNTTDITYNFYTDVNILQAKKAQAVLQNLQQRLEILIQEWPEQMVLQHLKERCDSVLSLDLLSPVAKILAAVELLLAQTDDWEIYANRHNSLKDHRGTLTKLIVEWRRLELSSWQGLLESQARAFEMGGSEWWFQLYDAIIRGPLNLDDEDPLALTAYLKTLIPLLDDFIRASPLDHYRLSLDRILLVLRSTIGYFEQFSSSILTHLSTQRAALENEIRRFIKLASWKDVNVQALKQSSKLVRSAGAPEEKSLPSEFGPPVTISIPTFPVSDAASTHLQNLTRTYSKFDELISQRIRPFIRARHFDAVNDFAVEIIETSQRLASIPAPAGLTNDKKEKHQKALLVRKRKAWSDLLKELKLAGFSPNDARWMREQPFLPSLSLPSLEKSEEYFRRLQGALPDLRSSLPTHHSDLTTRELQRAVAFLDSGLSVAIDSRAKMLKALTNFSQFKALLQRLRTLAGSPKIALFGAQTLAEIITLKDMLCRFASALREVDEGIVLHNDLHPMPQHHSVLQETRTWLQSTEVLRQRLIDIVREMRSSTPAILLQSEQAVAIEALDHLKRSHERLTSWGTNLPHLNYLFAPTLSWLTAQILPTFQRSPETGPEDASDTVIDTCLINIQGILGRCPELPEMDAEETKEHYIRDENNTIQSLTGLLNLPKLFSQLETSIRYFVHHGDVHQVPLQRVLPFLEKYSDVVEDQLTAHSHWTKALFKLIFVLCSVIQTLTKQGFCKPPPADEDGEQKEGGEAEAGLGIGEGSGADNVSKEIEDESQVEGLKGEEEASQDPGDSKDDKDALEMNEDFGGEMQDVPDDGDDEEGEGSDKDEEEEEPDDHLGDLGDSEEAVDEKLWADEKSGEEEQKKTDQDRSDGKSKEESDVVAKEGEKSKESKEKEKESQDQPPADGDEGEVQDKPMAEEEEPEAPNGEGAPMDDHVPDADTLDLPEDINLDGLGDENKDIPEPDLDDDLGGDDEMEDVQDNPVDNVPEHDASDEPQPDDQDQQMHEAPDSGEVDEDKKEENENPPEQAIAQADITSGDDAMNSSDTRPEKGGDTQTGESASSQGASGQATSAEKQEAEKAKKPEASAEQAELDSTPQPQQTQNSSDNAGSLQKGDQPSPADSALSNNPLRSLGDALKEIRHRFDEILESDPNSGPQEPTGEVSEPKQVEFLRPDDVDHDMQALGAAGDEQVAKLNQLTILDADNELDAVMDVDSEPPLSREQHEVPTKKVDVLPDPTPSERRDNTEDAVMHNGTNHASSNPASTLRQLDSETDDADDQLVEAELRQWQSSGLPDEGAEHMWHLYESLTHDLAYALCEQLRLILEPTMATRLKGDYRTGKRLNMKKIISYIASDYTKDKIWLRRTKPSQREYQVLIALDDSRSMAESHSVHLAYETLALVSKALSRLEAGDIGIVKFGQTVDVLHGFDQGPLTDQAGVKLMKAFKFDQKATNVLSLLNTSLQVLEKARERRSMSSSSAADLWQLEIIISDGICQDHEQLRSVLRKAEEQRVMMVFIIVDSLQSNVPNTKQTSANQGSILSMEKAEFKNVDGRMELQLQRYLDSFPFEYYVVLRNKDALPDVLSATIKQFFERISET